MKCEYPKCNNKAKHADTILYGFTCDNHFSMLDVHDDPDQYKIEMAKIERLEYEDFLRG